MPLSSFAPFSPLALTPVHFLAVDYGDRLCLTAWVGVERRDPQVMRRPPRPQRERLLNWPVALRAYLFLGLIEDSRLHGGLLLMLYGGGWKYGEAFFAQRPSLSAIHNRMLERHHDVMQVHERLPVRSTARSVFPIGLFGNRSLGGVWSWRSTLILLIPIRHREILSWNGAYFFGEVWLFYIPFESSG